jgi:hypothetical protein
MAEKEKRHLFDNPRNVKRAIYALYAVCGLSLIGDFIVQRHADHPWEAIFGFYSVYGFGACVLLVLISSSARRSPR